MSGAFVVWRSLRKGFGPDARTLSHIKARRHSPVKRRPPSRSYRASRLMIRRAISNAMARIVTSVMRSFPGDLRPVFEAPYWPPSGQGTRRVPSDGERCFCDSDKTSLKAPQADSERISRS